MPYSSAQNLRSAHETRTAEVRRERSTGSSSGIPVIEVKGVGEMGEGHTEEGTCRWAWVHDTLGQYHYETECGNHAFTRETPEEQGVERCYGCGRRIETASD